MTKKKIYIMATMILICLLINNFNSGTKVQANFTEESDELFFSDLENARRLDSISINSNEPIKLAINATNEEMKEAKITIPSSLEINLEQTQLYIQQEFPEIKDINELITINEEILTVHFLYEGSKIDFIPLVLNAKESINSKQELIATTTIGDTSYQSKKVTLNYLENNEQLIEPRAGDLNVDLHLEPVHSEIESGADGIFQLSFKVTGSAVHYKDATIDIQLPDNAKFDQELNTLKIADVIPTYNEQNHKLTYFFEEIDPGVSYTQLIKVQTENGTVADETQLKASAEFNSPDYQGDTRTEAVITVISSMHLSLNKKYLKTYDSNGYQHDMVPEAGETGEWQLKVNVPKRNTGQIYIQEGSQIVIEDQLPKELSYLGDSLDGIYDSKEHKVTWTFDAPSIENQQNIEEVLFSTDFTLQTKFPEVLTKMASYTNRLTVYITDVTGEKIEETTTAEVTVSPSSNNTLPPVNGSYLYPVHFGPLNGQGDTASQTSNANPNPTVYDSATLGFAVEASPMQADSPNKPFDKYEIIYKIDDHINLTNIYINYALYAPNYSYYTNNETRTLPGNATIADVYGTINGKEQLLIQNAEVGEYHNLKELGINEHISQLRVKYNYYAAGANQKISFKYEIQEGFTGQIKNSFGFSYTGYNRNGSKISQSQTAGGTAIWQYSEDRTANVIKTPSENSLPIVSNTIQFEKEEKGIVVSGKNRVYGTFKNDPSSLVNVNGPFDTYVLLPQGVTLDTDNPEYSLKVSNPWIIGSEASTEGTIVVEDENYLDQDQQLLHVYWDYASLVANETLSYGFNIVIDEDAVSFLRPEAYSFLGDAEFKVPSSTGELVTDSVIAYDSNDLIGNGTKNTKMVKTGNQYYLANASGVIIKELVKGELDEEFTQFGHTILGGNIDYRFELTNKGTNKISTMTLMNVLPSIGDLGITDNQPLGSMFTPIMTGAIELPSEWENKVEVFYSTATNPKRDDLNATINYPSTTQPIPNPEGAQAPNWMTEDQVSNWQDIHSFMIKLKDGQIWQSSETLVLDFNMTAPETLDKELIDASLPEYERAAWNSFAYTVNGLQAVEPNKVGVVVNNSFNLQLKKVDENDSTKVISGAEFTLYDYDKNEIETQQTDEEGMLRFTNLVPGNYLLQETKAPPYYELNNKLYEIEINNKGEISIKNSDEFIKEMENANGEAVIKLTLTNKLLRLPNTGSQKLIAFFIGGLLLVIIGGRYLLRRKYEKGR